jgi:ATP synthase protein I
VGKDKYPELGGLRALALVGQLGLTVVIPVVAGVLAGRFAETRVPSGGAVLTACILLGIAAGGYGAYRIVAKEIPWNR